MQQVGNQKARDFFWVCFFLFSNESSWEPSDVLSSRGNPQPPPLNDGPDTETLERGQQQSLKLEICISHQPLLNSFAL